MTLDQEKLVSAVNDVIEGTSSAGEVYSHNLRFEFGSWSETQIAKNCLRRHYNNRFKIKTEIQPPSDIDPIQNREDFNKKTKYYVLMLSRNLEAK